VRPLSVTRWGNGHGVRLPLSLLAALEAQEGDRFEVEAAPGVLVLRRVVRKDSRDLRCDEAPPMHGADIDAALQGGLRKVIEEAQRLSVLIELWGR
jgi:antitoxin component of MazEF toxin-antitoxin module